MGGYSHWTDALAIYSTVELLNIYSTFKHTLFCLPKSTAVHHKRTYSCGQIWCAPPNQILFCKMKPINCYGLPKIPNCSFFLIFHGTRVDETMYKKLKPEGWHHQGVEEMKILLAYIFTQILICGNLDEDRTYWQLKTMEKFKGLNKSYMHFLAGRKLLECHQIFQNSISEQQYHSMKSLNWKYLLLLVKFGVYMYMYKPAGFLRFEFVHCNINVSWRSKSFTFLRKGMQV